MPTQPQNDPPTETIAQGKFLRLVRRGKWEFVERTNASAIVGIVAVTDDGELVLIEQPRPAVGGPVIELPAGLVGDEGDAGEPLAEAARRELLEETGFEARDMTVLGAGAASAGLSNEIITLLRATGLRKVTDKLGVAGEQITLHLIPLGEVDAWLRTRASAGAIIDLKVYAGLHFARRP